MSRRNPLAAIVVLLVSLVPRVSPAIFHLSVIDEFMTSYGGDSTAQFIEIRMLATNQNFVGNFGGNSYLGIFDASGVFQGDALTITSDLPNSGDGVRWLMATASFATAAAITPDFTIPGPLYLPNAGGMFCWGKPSPSQHANPNAYVDCVAYGTYSGPTNLHIGTPTALTGEGHSLQRVSMSANNANDFACSDTATPTTNDATTVSLPATTACPPTPTPTVTPTVTPSPTPTPATNDAVALVLKPLSVKIPAGDSGATKTLKVKVRNANTTAALVPIKLSVTGCGGVAGTPDFGGAQDTVMLAGGKTAKAVVPLTISSAAVTSFNQKAPARCTLTFTANADVPGNIDPTTDNNVAQMELNVIDLNDPNQQAAPNHESTTTSLKPLTIKIAAGTTMVQKTIKLKVGNADAEADPGHQITVTLGAGDCPAAAVGLPDFDKETGGVQNVVTVAGEKTASGTVSVTLDPNDFTSPNGKSPRRCVRSLCAAGPMGNVEPDTSNDCTQLTIDVIDQNDF